jgi:hypothetical protein
VAFGPDGTYVAIADTFGGLQLRDAVNLRLIHQLRRSETPEDYGYAEGPYYTHVAFTPDGQRLLSDGTDQLPTVWDVGLEALVARICHIANRNLTHDEWAQYVGEQPYHPTCPSASLPEEPG